MVKGTIAPGRVAHFTREPDGTVKHHVLTGEEARLFMKRSWDERKERKAAEIRETRDQLAMTQAQFAKVLGVSTRTLQQWEQQRREPNASAKVLLAIAKKHPRIVRQAARELALA